MKAYLTKNVMLISYLNFNLQKDKKEKEVVPDTDVGSGRSIPIRQVRMDGESESSKISRNVYIRG